MFGRGVTKRIWAVLLTVCMTFAAFGAVSFGTAAKADTGAASLLTAGDIAVSISAERLASSYTSVSAAFTARAYSGSDLSYKMSETALADSQSLLTDDSHG